ncbi:MAG: cytochrome c maturation protein CcmE [Chloroflexi bacterium]|nr:cytochrome c maturation protein CcmE [Chloroflexota bacterium]
MQSTETYTENDEGAGSPAPSLLGGWRKLLIGGVVVAIALGFLAFNAFQGAAVYYLTVGELLDRDSAGLPKSVRVSGALVPGTFQQEAGTATVRFRITDGTSELPAVYTGVVPDLFFNEQSQVVLEGNFASGGVFQAQQVLVKCPSKYEAQASA